MNIKVGDIYEDCAYHPVRCTVSNKAHDALEGISLVDGSGPRSCSFIHCGIKKLTQEEADALIALWKSGGEKAVLISRGWSVEKAEEFIRDWR